MEQAVIYSPVGPLTLFAEDDFLTALVYGDYGGYDDIPLFREARRQLDEYFDGQRQAFHLPLRPEGTEFQKKVWQVLCRIPYGQMISYRELATRVGAPRAFQAVGQANGHNPPAHPDPMSPGHCRQRDAGRLFRGLGTQALFAPFRGP